MDKNLLVRQTNWPFFSLPTGIKDWPSHKDSYMIYFPTLTWKYNLNEKLLHRSISCKSMSVDLIYPQQLCGAAVGY